MSECAYCHQDKGKRSCPALGGAISAKCCGQHRGLRIDCPIDCRYYRENEEIQRERLSHTFHAAWLKAVTPLYHDKRPEILDWIVLLEASIYVYFQTHTRASDHDLREALDTLKNKLSPISIIETASSGLSKHLEESGKEALESRGNLDSEEAQEGVQLLINIIDELVDEEHERQALHGLLGHVEGFIGAPERPDSQPSSDPSIPKIITPGEI